MTERLPEDAPHATPTPVSRRDMLAATAAALATPLLPLGRPAPRPASSGAPQYLTESEFAVLDELTELVIPTDANSPGARTAQVAAYIDARLAESLEPDWQALWRTGLKALDDLSRELHGKAFLEAAPDQRVAVLTRLAAAERDPKTPAEHFFRELKTWTVRGYYTSKVGIHLDQEYKGNVYQQGDYAGYDAT